MSRAAVSFGRRKLQGREVDVWELVATALAAIQVIIATIEMLDKLRHQRVGGRNQSNDET